VLAATHALSGCNLILDADRFGDDLGDGGGADDGAFANADATINGIDARLTPDACVAPLLDNGSLLVRYWIDEASSGTMPTALIDSSANGSDIPITYEDSLAYSEVGSNRGLEWPSAGAGGGASIGIGSSPVAAVDGQASTTIELVVDLGGQVGMGGRHYLLHIGKTGETGAFSLFIEDSDNLVLSHQNLLDAKWEIPDLSSSGRTILQLASNTAAPDDPVGQRAILYRDGVVVPRLDTTIIPDSLLFITNANTLTIGNNLERTASIQGRISYFAMYGKMFTANDAANNAGALCASDDGP